MLCVFREKTADIELTVRSHCMPWLQDDFIYFFVHTRNVECYITKLVDGEEVLQEFSEFGEILRRISIIWNKVIKFI